jgi:hypothetical protein
MVTWGLTPTTQRVAEWVLARWPQLRITSGRRSLDEQIRVMTRNTRRYGRDWIQQTYRATPLVRRIVDAVAGATDDGLDAAIETVIRTADESEQYSLSRHLTGHAFDCAWPGEEGEAIAIAIREHPCVEKVITREGGLRILHIQCREESCSDTESSSV